ncbi:hypothetical protein ACFLRW_04190 [Acidobacteriota bacterium]
MKIIQKLATIFLFITPLLFVSGCDLITKLTEHEIVVEDNAYLRGKTSGAGFINLMDNADWRTYKKLIKEITKIQIQYRVTRNTSLSDISVNFFFGEDKADTLLGNAYLAKGETQTELHTLEMERSYYELVSLIMRKDSFWYSIRGNTDLANVDFEPVLITVFGTFDVN